MTAAMILCAGFGTRLNKLTKQTPKPMLRVGGRPMLEYMICHLRHFGITKIVINLHYRGEQIVDHFGDGKRLGVEIDYSWEHVPLGTAGAVRNVAHILKQHESFWVIYGDIVSNFNLTQIHTVHQQHKPVGTIVLHERAHSNSVVEIEKSGKISRFIERPEGAVKNKKQNWVNSGMYLFSSEILNYIPEGVADFPRDIFPELVEKQRLWGNPIDGYRCAIDSGTRYESVCRDYNSRTFTFSFLS